MAKKLTLRDALLSGPRHGIKHGPPSWIDVLAVKHRDEAAELRDIIDDFIRGEPAIRAKFDSRSAFAVWLCDQAESMGVTIKPSSMRTWLHNRNEEFRDGRRA